jgi:tetratricopeptide (TPR) repeat protein
MTVKRMMLAVLILLGLYGGVAFGQADKAEMQRLLEDGLKATAAARYPQALAAYRQGLEVARKSQQIRAQAAFLTNIGIVHNNLRQYDQALAHYQQALAISTETKDRRSEGAVLNNIGLVYNKLGQYGQALGHHQQALAIKRELQDQRGEGTTLIYISNAYDDLGQYDQALSHYQQALTIMREIKDRRGEGNALDGIGVAYDNLGQYDQALVHHQQALAIKREIKDFRGEGTALTNIGVVSWQLGRYDQALAYHQQGLAIKREIADRAGEAVALTNIGLVYKDLGQYDQALSHYQQALAIMREIKDRRGEGAALGNIGLIYNNLGQYDQALAHYRQALAIDKQIKDRRGESTALTNIGLVYKNLGQYDKALAHYRQALALDRQIKDRQGEGDDLNNIGVYYLNLGRYEPALAHYRQALVIYQEIKDRQGEGNALSNIGMVYGKLGQYEKAQAALTRSLQICREVGAPESIWRVQYGLGAAEAQLGQDGSAIQKYEQALDTIESMRGGLQEKEAKASFMQDKLHVYDELIELLRSRHEQDPSKGYDRKSWEIFERKQGRQFLEEMGKSGARHFAGLPEEINQQEAELENRLDKLQAGLSKERARPEPDHPRIQTLEGELQQAKAAFQTLKDQLRTTYPDYYALKYPQPASLSELQTQVLRPGEVLLVYGVMPDRTCLWVINPEKFVLYTLPVGEKELADKVNRYRQGPDSILQAIIKTPSSSNLQRLVDNSLAQVAPIEQELYDLLLPEAARQLISSAPVLYIVPTGPLYRLPFEALRTQAGGPGGRYLIEDHALAYLSSASLLKTLREAKLRKKEPAAYPLLAFANPEYAAALPPAATPVAPGKTRSAPTKTTTPEPLNFQGLRTRAYLNIMGGEFCPLPDTETEVKEIKDILQAPDPTQPLQLRQAAARSRVLAFNQADQLRQYRYLVFACHGILPGEVDQVTQPALVLSNPDPQTQAPGFLTMADVFGLRLHADLVTLSACNSGGGQAQKGEGVIGLTRAFMYAGTASIAVTLWSVESGSATALNTGFYRQLQSGRGRAAALRESKLRLLRGEAGELYKHPFFWAPLVVFGEGR